MEDDSSDNPFRDQEVFILTGEENALAERLSGFSHGDFARVLNQLSPAAKDELRSAIGFLDAYFSSPQDEQ